MTIAELREWIKLQLAKCNEENWYPDDDSKREGYMWAMEEVLWYIDKDLDAKDLDAVRTTGNTITWEDL